MKIELFVLLYVYLVQASIYEKYYKEAALIVESMKLQQKIGQTIEVDARSLVLNNNTSNQLLVKYSIGAVLIGDNCPDKHGNLYEVWNMKLNDLETVYAEATLQKFQKFTLKTDFRIKITTKDNTRYIIKPFFSTDPVHGDHKIAGNIIFPHNVGVSCSHNPDNFYNMGYWGARTLKSYGFNWGHVPTVAVSHNPQWGRFYETMGQDHDMIYQYAEAFTEGFQGKLGKSSGVLGTAKHFFADGATFYGANQGNSLVGSFKNFINHNVQGFNSSIKAGVATVMPSFSAINFMTLSSGSFLQKILNDDLEFDGFIVSDYNAINFCSFQGLPTSFAHMSRNESIATMFTSGVDMFMMDNKTSVINYVNNFKMGLKNNTIRIQRLNNAVMKILAVKLAFGLVKVSGIQEDELENQIAFAEISQIDRKKSYIESIRAVQQSLVLLKNNHVIPLGKQKIKYVVFVGESIIDLLGQNQSRLFQNYDNIGMQCGGWSVKFQGFNGNAVWSGVNKKTSNASSILDGFKNLNQKVEFICPNYTDLYNRDLIEIERKKFLEKLNEYSGKMNSENTAILGVIGQTPYAQTAGDVNIPYCQNPQLFQGKGCLYYTNFYTPSKQINTLQIDYSDYDKSVINKIKNMQRDIPLVTILLSGRPMIINQALTDSQAFISAFLPGTSGGQGIANAIFGEYLFRSNPKNDRVNTLSMDWPKDMDSLKNFPYYAADGQIPRIPNLIFKPGYGLSTKVKNIQLQKQKQQ